MIELRIPENAIEPLYDALNSNDVDMFALSCGFADEREKLKEFARDNMALGSDVLLELEGREPEALSAFLSRYDAHSPDDAFELDVLRAQLLEAIAEVETTSPTM